MKTKRASYKLLKHWKRKLAKLQRINLQNEKLNIGFDHDIIRWRLTQIAIKYKL